MPDGEKSEIIGRDYTRVRPHHGYDSRPENPRLGEGGEDEFASVEGMPPRSHVARAFGSMMRQAYPYRRPTEEGLFFTAYARFLSEIDTALNRMCGHYEVRDPPPRMCQDCVHDLWECAGGWQRG
jgi:deferrochelatase/peroxidase EfeB